MPTYRSAARVLEGQKAAGWELAGWTVARTILIFPPMMAVGVPFKQALLGAGLASMLISTLAALRIFDAKHMGLKGQHGTRALRAR
jgi:hypothetical protein